MQYADHLKWADPSVSTFPLRRDLLDLAATIESWGHFAWTIGENPSPSESAEFSQHAARCEWLVRRIMGVETILGVQLLFCDDREFDLFLARIRKHWRGWKPPILDAAENTVRRARGLAQAGGELGNRIRNAVRESQTLRSLAQFIPSPIERMILDALDGQALTVDELEAACRCSRPTLYGGKTKKDGIRRLLSLGEIASRKKGGGFYRPDAPPKDC